jgi:hypothetical protein
MRDEVREGERERERERDEVREGEREREIYTFILIHTESILAGVQSVDAVATSTNEIAINFGIFENITCIVQRDRLITAHICLANSTCESANYEFDPTNCQNQSVGEGAVKFQDLLASSEYCVRANVSYGNATRVLSDSTVYTDATTTTERLPETTEHTHATTTTQGTGTGRLIEITS